MKKLLSMILALCLAVSLAACAKPAEKEPTEPTATVSAAATDATKPTEAATTQSVAPTIATAEAPEFATDPSEGETDVIASEVTEASTPAIATKAPTEAAKQLGSTPKKPITVVTATASPTAKPATTATSAPTVRPTSTATVQPTAAMPTTSPTGPLPSGLYVNVPDFPDYDTFASTGTSYYGEVTGAQLKVGKVTQDISPNDPRLIQLLNFIGPAVKDPGISVVRQGLVDEDEIQDIDRTAPSVLKITLANHEKFSQIWIYGDTFLGIKQAGASAEQVSPYMCLAVKAGWKQPAKQSDPTREVWIDLLQYAGFGPEISAAPTAPTEYATVGTVAPGSLAGKTLTVYGLGVSDPQVDYGSYYDEAYKRMMRTAADEWAAMNGVTIRYMGSYNQNTVVSSYGGAGDPCDLVIPMNNMGDLVEIGFASPFTEAEYNTLAALVGDDRYLDVVSRKDQSYGIVLPWAGNMMVYFNQSMFEKYNVKSPLEYYNEGNWAWESFAKCMAEITRDLDGDGTTDIYGLPGDSWINLVNPERRDTFTGELLSTIDDPWIQDLITLKYDAFRVTGSSRLGGNNIKTNTGSPVYAMEISACEAYDPQDVFQVSAGGDALIAVPLPRWEGEDGQSKEWVHLTQMTAHIFSGTKEREAVFDLLCYLTKCGMKYMADCSLGVISCDYTGIQGITDGARQWKADFAADLQQRKAELQKLSCYDEAYVAKVTKSLSQADEWFTYNPYYTYIQYFNFLTCIEIYEKPPAESVPLIKEKYLAALESYNKLYFS